MIEGELLAPLAMESNVSDLLEHRVTSAPDGVLFSLPTENSWTPVTAQQFHSEVKSLAKGLIALGLTPGTHVGMMCHQRYEWTLIDFAVWYAGAILVPIYETSSPEQIKWIINDAEVTALFVENPDLYSKMDEIREHIPQLSKVWTIDLGAITDIQRAGEHISDEQLKDARTKATANDIATIIYTSGTTGKPKGTVLLHRNFVDLARNSAVALNVVIRDPDGSSTLLFITSAHIFARFISVLCVYAGVRVGHQANPKKLLPSMQSFQPTFLLAVPRVFEKVYNVSEQKAEASGKGKLFRKAAEVAIEYSEKKQSGSKMSPLLTLQYSVFKTLIYKKMRKAMGGKIKYAVSGSAPLGKTLGHFFHSIGLTVLEGYGLTETTAAVTINRPGNSKIGTVGIPLPGVKVRLSVENEIEICGIGTFPSYWKNDEETRNSFRGEWFQTGDIGSIDQDGFLTITGRKKEIIVTSSGKNVAPAILEAPLRANPLISQVLVIGDQKPFISALITLDMEILPSWLKNSGISSTIPLSEARHIPEVRREIQEAIYRANTQVSQAESIREFRILATEFSEASGHMTPKMSLKREEILKDFGDTISEIYSHQNRVS